MPGVRALRKIQGGRETTAGTEVNSTVLFRCTGTPDDLREVVTVEEDVGYLSGVDRVITPKVYAGLTMEGVATFEQLPHILEAGVKTVSGSKDGAGSGYVYTYTFATTAAPTIKTYTIEAGDDQQEEQFLYGFVEAFKLSGKGGEAVMMSADWRGRQLSPDTFTGSISLPTVDEILVSKGCLYIDATTIGTTTKSNTLLGFEFPVKTGLVPVFAADGNLFFSFVKSVTPELTLNLTFEHDSIAVAEKAAWRAETTRLIRLKFLGDALTTPGTSYTHKTLIIDLAGKWEKFDKIGEQDRNDIVTGTFRARYDSTATKFAEITVVNELTSL